jgi:hypothetical protein
LNHYLRRNGPEERQCLGFLRRQSQYPLRHCHLTYAPGKLRLHMPFEYDAMNMLPHFLLQCLVVAE